MAVFSFSFSKVLVSRTSLHTRHHLSVARSGCGAPLGVADRNAYTRNQAEAIS